MFDTKTYCIHATLAKNTWLLVVCNVDPLKRTPRKRCNPRAHRAIPISATHYMRSHVYDNNYRAHDPTTRNRAFLQYKATANDCRSLRFVHECICAQLPWISPPRLDISRNAHKLVCSTSENYPPSPRAVFALASSSTSCHVFGV